MVVGWFDCLFVDRKTIYYYGEAKYGNKKKYEGRVSCWQSYCIILASLFATTQAANQVIDRWPPPIIYSGERDITVLLPTVTAPRNYVPVERVIVSLSYVGPSDVRTKRRTS